MDIPKSDGFRVLVRLVLSATIISVVGQLSFAAAEDQADFSAPRRGRAESKVAELNRSLQNDNDRHKDFRLRYQMAMTRFKESKLDSAESEFRKLIEDSACPEDVRILSLNMIGQICRLQAKEQEAIKAFGQVLKAIEQSLASKDSDPPTNCLKQLFCLVTFSRAEIYEFVNEYQAAVLEYKRLLEFIKEIKGESEFSRFIAPARDRICQLYLQQGHIKEYIASAEALIAECPHYYRIPLVSLEVECLKFLKKQGINYDCSMGTFGIPASVLAYLKSSQAKVQADDIIDMAGRLYKKYRGTYGAVLLGYHYGWFLDTIGRKNEAAKILHQVYTEDIVDTDKSRREIINTVRAYACIQSALILSEMRHYREAIQTLQDLKSPEQQSHISKLAKSIRETIKILKSEVTTNDNKKSVEQ